MKVHLEPIGTYSPSMLRVARALERYAPPDIEIVKRPDKADLQIHHVHQVPTITTPRYAIIQYCLLSSAMPDAAQWLHLWSGSDLVWSYYDLSPYFPRFYHAPLGIDPAFLLAPLHAHRDLIVTTGHVAGYPAEAIEEVWSAAEQLGIKGFHVGPPHLENSSRDLPSTWRTATNISDAELATLYSRALMVGALRHTEGFELPAAEGLACGARPLLFDQPALRHWYGHHATYLPCTSGADLVSLLHSAIEEETRTVRHRPSMRDAAMTRFNWQEIATGFWQHLLD